MSMTITRGGEDTAAQDTSIAERDETTKAVITWPEGCGGKNAGRRMQRMTMIGQGSEAGRRRERSGDERPHYVPARPWAFRDPGWLLTELETSDGAALACADMQLRAREPLRKL